MQAPAWGNWTVDKILHVAKFSLDSTVQTHMEKGVRNLEGNEVACFRTGSRCRHERRGLHRIVRQRRAISEVAPVPPGPRCRRLRCREDPRKSSDGRH